MINVTLKQRDAAFAMQPLAERKSTDDLTLLKQLKTGLANYTPTALITVQVTSEDLYRLYTIMANKANGLTAGISDSIMNDSEGYTGLLHQLTTQAQQGNTAAIEALTRIGEFRANYETMITQVVDASLQYLQNLDV